MGNLCFHKNMCSCFSSGANAIVAVAPEPKEMPPISLKESNHQKIKMIYNNYKENLKSLEKYLNERQSLVLTAEFWRSQKNCEEKFMKLWKQLNKDPNPYSEILLAKFQNLKYNYKKILVYLYNTDKLIIANELEETKEVRDFFQIRNTMIRFSSAPIIHIIPRRDSTIEVNTL